MRLCSILFHLYIIDYRPRDYRELFNLRHARLRNAIERIFGVLKRRFRVLVSAQEYSLAVQVQLVPATAVLHNFIITHDPDDISLDEEDTEPNVGEVWSDHHAAVHREERTRAAECWDRIARAMWDEFIARPPRRRR